MWKRWHFPRWVFFTHSHTLLHSYLINYSLMQPLAALLRILVCLIYYSPVSSMLHLLFTSCNKLIDYLFAIIFHFTVQIFINVHFFFFDFPILFFYGRDIKYKIVSTFENLKIQNIKFVVLDAFAGSVAVSVAFVCIVACTMCVSVCLCKVCK